MIFYVYVVTIEHPKLGELYYVGRHKWEGSSLDPSYFGSCKYPHYRRWISEYPHKIQLLEECCTEQECALAEQQWIQYFCSEFGVLPQIKHLHPGWSHWKDGCCLNGHDSACTLLHSEKCRKKLLETQKSNGSFARFLASTHTPEYLEKWRKSEAFSNFMKAGHTPEAREKRIHNTDQLAKAQRISDTKRQKAASGWVPNTGVVFTATNGISTYKGALGYICRELGNPHWACSVSQYMAKHNVSIYFHKTSGYTFSK